MALSGLHTGVRALFDTQPEDGFAVHGTNTSNSFAAGSYGSSGSMGCQPFGCFDGLPAVLRRSVSGRIFLDQPLPEPYKPLMHLCKPGPCHVAPAPKEPVCSPTSVLGMAGEASSVEEESTLLASVSSQGLLAAQHSPLDQD
ncbi:hypothetical protein COHA_001346 [Chlorella ohadii]|uniref:Uncharacterized protein n=1 Tax=Chlorella ohadii TaxID=2649997 RepID=A0AAD5DZ91_9CHLO|nr:hypothetical protein COHA_001346 [Chlorella ohadii]